MTRETVVELDVSKWPFPGKLNGDKSSISAKLGVLWRAAKFLEATPAAFATAPSISDAYERLEASWKDRELEQADPRGELLTAHAHHLANILNNLSEHPRAVLRSEHRMLKLQNVRRTDSKTLRWLSAQPGRNTAERAGARQRIKAPKRYETISTLENRVLRAFAALTVRETRAWLGAHDRMAASRLVIEAHQNRARRVEALLRIHGVQEAQPPVKPNFPLRFDVRYREIFRAWNELLRLRERTELEWMWQHRTFMELLSVRAAMKLREAAHRIKGCGMLAHAPVLGAKEIPNQGKYLAHSGVEGILLVSRRTEGQVVAFCCGDGVKMIGAVADTEHASSLWWNVSGTPTEGEALVGELPWTECDSWDCRLEKWAKGAIS
ncbi:MAG: DUF2357 domain-containing protein [Rhodobacteraceae bacterium]|nr:DUF2357 domain-containing protein [Paracoccaceae bacterium]